jgi:2-polyprenyl-3-methyl-5-hydroxy-6-metoxy-1,4-benzoquinol methylase
MNKKIRIEREEKFHDLWANEIDINQLLVREAFESPTAYENKYVLSQIESIKNKNVLDLGCGAGEASVYFALNGANVFGIDISNNLLGKAKMLSEKYAVKIKFSRMQSGNLDFKDDFFDIVYGNGILHHVDIPSTLTEINRVLKPGGKAFFIEPLQYNPIINIYRLMAYQVRTTDETPISWNDLNLMDKYFSHLEHKEFWFFSLSIFLFFFFVKRWNPSSVRYWKKVIEVGDEYKLVVQFLSKIDQKLMESFPSLRPYCWNTVIKAIK